MGQNPTTFPNALLVSQRMFPTRRPRPNQRTTHPATRAVHRLARHMASRLIRELSWGERPISFACFRARCSVMTINQKTLAASVLDVAALERSEREHKELNAHAEDRRPESAVATRVQPSEACATIKRDRDCAIRFYRTLEDGGWLIRSAAFCIIPHTLKGPTC